jgi:hypothetical protein
MPTRNGEDLRQPIAMPEPLAKGAHPPANDSSAPAQTVPALVAVARMAGSLMCDKIA